MDGQPFSFFKGKDPFAIIPCIVYGQASIMGVKGKETMAKRKDIHAPSTFDPAAYTYQGTVLLYWASCSTELSREFQADLDALTERVTAGGFVGNFSNKGTCDHCGAHFHYGAEYKHKDGDVIVVGHICADEAFGCDDRRAYDLGKTKRRAKALRERIRAHAEAEAFIKEHDLAAVFAEAHLTHDSKGGDILADLHRKLIQWGSLTDKQAAFARKLADEIANPKAIVCDFCGEAEHAAKECTNRASVPLTDERIVVTARIITARYEETQYGSSLKGLFETPTGFKLWGTIPAAIYDAVFTGEHAALSPTGLDELRGKYVTFTAKVSRSDRDASFGFINRPTKAGLAEPFENTPVFPGGTPESSEKTDDELRDVLVAARKAL